MSAACVASAEVRTCSLLITAAALATKFIGKQGGSFRARWHRILGHQCLGEWSAVEKLVGGRHPAINA